MNCHEAYLWMLEAEEPTASPPAPVAEHLRGCPKCRRRQQRVLGLLTSVRTLPGPPENPQVREEVKELVKQLPVGPAQTPAPARPRLLPFRRWAIPTGIAATAAAAMLLLGLIGVLLAHYFLPPAQPGKPTLVAKHSWKEGELRTKLLTQMLKLTEVETPVERLHALTDMAVDLQVESVTQADRMDDADLLRLAALYELVLDDGIMQQARALPPDQRPKELPLLVAVLQNTQTEAKATALQSPDAAAPLQRVAVAAGKAKSLLEDNPQLVKWPAPKPVQAPLPQASLIETLVARSLALANENDPLKRAEVCQDVANSLWEQTIAEASKGEGNSEEMTKLGASLDVVMERAVHGNLKRVEATRKGECDQFRQGLEKMLNRWKGDMQSAPEHSRSGLEHVFKKASRFSTFNNLGPPHFNKDMNKGDRDRDRDKFKGKRSSLLRLLHEGARM